MSGNVFTWYLKEHLLETKQISIHVGDPPKKPITRDKIKPLGSQRVEWGNANLNMCYYIQKNKVIVLVKTSDKLSQP